MQCCFHSENMDSLSRLYIERNPYVKANRIMNNILTKITDLQTTLNQQDSIYQSHQTLHFDWLNSVLFQLKVYDQNDTESSTNICQREKPIISDINTDSQIVNTKPSNKINCKPSPPIPKIPERIHKYQNQNENADNNTINQSNTNKNENGMKKSIVDLKPTPRKIKIGGHRTAMKHTSTPIIPAPHVSPTIPKTILKNTKKNEIDKNLKQSESNNKAGKTPKRGTKNPSTHKTDSTLSKKNSLVKFIDNDSLLSISQSSDSFAENDSDSENITLLQIQTQPGVINLNELNLSVSCFQEQWHEMVEEKKRATLSPKQPLGVLFEFDDSPNNYQITDSDEGFMSSDDEIQDSNPVEIHGKIIPIWARKENVEKQLRKQIDKNSDEIFINMPKHCILENIFDDLPEKVITKSDSNSFDEVDNRNILLMSEC